MGAAGDMLMAALSELHPQPEDFVARFNALGIPGVTLRTEKTEKCGITGTRMNVEIEGTEEKSEDVPVHGHPEHVHQGHSHHHGREQHSGGGHSHHHTSLADIEHILSHLAVPDKVKTDALSVYRLIAEAESHAHGRPVEQIHFHEVGLMDAVADVVGVCLLMDELAPDYVAASPIHVGSGHVRCAHGILPVPAPATAYILQDVPVYGGSVEGELCTPTGAALLKYFVRDFGQMPLMRIQQTGYGMGTKDFAMANCVRAMLGEQERAMDDIVELCCNLDDMTPEEIGFATGLFMEEGALDVYTSNVQMKKNRPGIILTCMCRSGEKEKFLRLIFRHTSTLGVREYTCRRYGLKRETEIRQTPLGDVRAKRAEGYGVSREKWEYEDLAGLARESGLSISEVKQRISDNLA